jgi:hypothetical protein
MDLATRKSNNTSKHLTASFLKIVEWWNNFPFFYVCMTESKLPNQLPPETRLAGVGRKIGGEP